MNKIMTLFVLILFTVGIGFIIVGFINPFGELPVRGGTSIFLGCWFILFGFLLFVTKKNQE